MNSRLLHYRVALFATVFIATSAVTGLLWAYAPYLYWQDGYLQKNSGTPAIALSEVKFSISDLRATVDALTGSPDAVIGITLRQESEVPVYEVTRRGAAPKLLLDARDGKLLSPLSRDFAVKLGQQYAPSGAPVSAATESASWEDRKGKVHRLVWTITFADDAKTEVVLDADSGAIIEDSDTTRRIHFWVMKLHQFNFFGTHKVLTAVSGVPLLILLISGLILGWKRLRRGRT